MNAQALVAIYSARTKQPTQQLTIPGPSDMAVDRFGNVYVADGPGGFVRFYKSAGPGIVKRTNQIRMNKPDALVADLSGNLFVLKAGQTIVEYPPGKAAPSRVIGGLFGIVAMVVDHSGNLYVVNGNNPQGGSVSVYKPGATVPYRKLTRGLVNPVAIAVDSSNNVFVANYVGNSGYVTEFGFKGSVPKRTIRQGIGQIRAMAVSPSASLYVANYETPASGPIQISIEAYAPGALQPTLTIAGAGCHYELCDILSLAFDSLGRLYVPHIEQTDEGDPRPASITIYKKDQGSVWGRITASLQTPSKIAVLPSP